LRGLRSTCIFFGENACSLSHFARSDTFSSASITIVDSSSAFLSKAPWSHCRLSLTLSHTFVTSSVACGAAWSESDIVISSVACGAACSESDIVISSIACGAACSESDIVISSVACGAACSESDMMRKDRGREIEERHGEWY